MIEQDKPYHKIVLAMQRIGLKPTEDTNANELRFLRVADKERNGIAFVLHSVETKEYSVEFLGMFGMHQKLRNFSTWEETASYIEAVFKSNNDQIRRMANKWSHP